MSLGRWSAQHLYLYRDPVDMRKGMDALAVLVDQEMKRNVLSPSLFVFTNKKRDKIKLLIWERNGFWVLYKKLLKERFKWPKWFEGDQLILSEHQLDKLLSGYDLNGMRPHDALSIQHLL